MRYSLLIIFSCLSISLFAQNVTNVTAGQEGNLIRVYYTLESAGSCEISLRFSTDDGLTWSEPLQKVSGDVGAGILPGERSILWDVLKERDHLQGVFRFKVSARTVSLSQPVLEMIKVNGGTFKMGSEAHGGDSEPSHLVELSTFFIGKFEITQRQWKTIMGDIPNQSDSCDECPVESISWNACQEFIRELNRRTGLNFRLPTEAEWEFAAIGGRQSLGYTYSGSDILEDVAWYQVNSDYHVHQVGQKKPNELGIFDMSGNVWEWCSDWHGAYLNSSSKNPQGPAHGEMRIRRGGAYYLEDRYLEVRHRSRRSPEENRAYYGFRIAVSAGNLASATIDLSNFTIIDP